MGSVHHPYLTRSILPLNYNPVVDSFVCFSSASGCAKSRRCCRTACPSATTARESICGCPTSAARPRRSSARPAVTGLGTIAGGVW